ncbi:response regulator [Chitinophagaceae bacterium MMS25-I14]
MPIQVVITDDHPLAVSGIQRMLEDQHDITVSATYHTAAQLIEGLRQHQPDVLLLDILLPDQPGHELVPQIVKNYPDIQIVALTSLDAPALVKSMLYHGCKGYLLKGTDQETLVAAIRSAHEGVEFLEPSLRDYLLPNTARLQRRELTPLDLTRREKEVLQLIVAGNTTQEIADKLFISPRTAETHRLTLLKKLDVKNTAGLVRMAIISGLAE